MIVTSHHQMVSDMIISELTIGDQVSFLVTSNSMQPLMKTSDMVVVEIIAGSKVKRGDIIVIKRADGFLTHRAISPTKDGWLTKGDSNILPDSPVKYNDIIGRVKMIQQANLTLNMEARKWAYLNPSLAKLGEIETWAFSHHRYLRLPFRIMIKVIQKLSILHLG